jgi:hypothetical protein
MSPFVVAAQIGHLFPARLEDTPDKQPNVLQAAHHVVLRASHVVVVHEDTSGVGVDVDVIDSRLLLEL